VGLHGGRRMEAVVARHPPVEWGACGHIHRPIQVAWGGTVASTAPSTPHAQVAPALTEASGFEVRDALGPPAGQLYVRDPGYGFVCHVSYVSGAGERYRSGSAERLREDFRHRYEGLCRSEFDAAAPGRRP